MHKNRVTHGNVSPLFAHRSMMKNNIAEEVLNYWEDLRQGRLVPKRSEIDPRKFRTALNYTFILEASTPDNIRFRLAGNKLCDCMGMEMRGMPAYAMFDMSSRNNFNQALQNALARPELLDIQLTPTAKMLLLPMANEEDAINRILGCVTVDPQHPDFPTRFHIQSIGRTRIIAATAVKPHLVTGLAEDQKAFSPDGKKATPGKPPYLRIIK